MTPLSQTLLQIIQRDPRPEPWAEGEKIPWNEPEFSQRMLNEHLSQAHDLASRRNEIIQSQVEWIDQHLLGGQPARVLDLGCGPGLYSQQLASRGHTCTGIDFGPASIDYARRQAQLAGLNIEYRLEDLRQATFSADNDLVMLIFGEMNTFRKQEIRQILKRAWQALKPGGKLLLEPSRFEHLHSKGVAPAHWWSSESGLFSAQPHLVLLESFWDETQAIETDRFYIIDASSGEVQQVSASSQAYQNTELEIMLNEVGFQQVTFLESLGEMVQPDVFGLTAVK